MGIEPTGAGSIAERPANLPAPSPYMHANVGCRINAATRTRTQLGDFVKAQKAPERDESAPNDAAFRKTLRTMLSTPPKPHDEMKVGAARKRDTRSSGKGAKG